MDIGVLISSGRWVLREACTQNVAWQRMGVPPISMGINLSALQFGNASLLADIRSALLHSGMDLSLLELELTEHMVIQNLEQAMDILGAIKREGGREDVDGAANAGSAALRILDARGRSAAQSVARRSHNRNGTVRLA